MIEFEAVTKKYGSRVAVNSVSLFVRKGESFALLGPNGAGKTTIVKMLFDFIRPDSGRIHMRGLPCSLSSSRKGVGYLPENFRAPPYLTGLEYLMRCCSLTGFSNSAGRKECLRLIELIGLKGRELSKVGTYSKGMVQRLGLGAALIGSPELLVLDEPVAGLDPLGIREIRILLESLREEGVTVFLNSHLLSEVERICDYAAIIQKGRLLMKENITNLIREGETLEDVYVRVIRN
ncbi:MAG TPA: ABC transporter ATP-binding protein [Syntrophorhabdaceae bacterium]|nr:ABC transporter ATP-binding protein [Syntrophorhabdaceae bacterium]